ncbi:MAG: outer membrane protein assembly factor BamB [Halobacteriales archaeon]|jgi:outer membrane protein assembly factor BamB
MPAHRSRRAVLAAIGTVVIAGCTTDDDATGDTTQESSTSTSSETGSTPVTTRPTTTSTESTPSTTAVEEPDPPTRIESRWPMPAHDSGRSNFAPEAAGPTDPVHELWAVSGDEILSAPVLADETLFVGGENGTVLALDARTGEERWRRSVGKTAHEPRVLGGQLFVPTGSSIVALATADGSEAWRTETPNRVDSRDSGPGPGTRATLTVAAHGAYWLSGSGAGSPAVVALGLADGKQRWRTAIRDPWSPRLFASDGSVFLSTGTNGRIPWRFNPDTGAVANEPQRGNDFPAEQFALNGTVYGVDPFFGIVHGPGWTTGRDGFATGGDYHLSGGATHVYYVPNSGDGSGPGLFALSRETGAVAWTAETLAAPAGRPVVAGETILVRTDEALHCFDPADGSERWQRSNEGIGEGFLVADDLVYAAEGETVRALRPA